jgi:ribonuclease HII
VDEVGRGCLFGPVAAGAVILPVPCRIPGIRDSKIVPEEERNLLAAAIREKAVAWSVSFATVEEIEQLNIREASRLAMARAVSALPLRPDILLIDAMTLDLPLPQQAVIHGDSLCRSIAAASLVAKVARDAAMAELASQFPAYGLASNKGYGTPDHLRALELYGPTPFHRATFAPVRAAIANRRQEASCHAG